MQTAILNDKFTITVAAFPDAEVGLSLKKELQLLKTALIYADNVRLCSPLAFILLSTLYDAVITTDNHVLQEYFSSRPKGEQIIAALIELKEQPKKALQQLSLLRLNNSDGHESQVVPLAFAEKVLSAAGFESLIEPTRLGLVALPMFNIKLSDSPNGFQQLEEQYWYSVSKSILRSDSYPLFDKVTLETLQSDIQRGSLLPSEMEISQAKQVALSSELLQRLPRFENASLHEILDIRRELNGPLVRFRSAIVQYSRQVQSAPWDKDFPIEANEVFVEHLAPAILEIEEACRSNSFLRKLLPSLGEKPIEPLGAPVMGLIVANSAHLSEILATGVGLVGGSALLAYRTYDSFKQERQRIESNQLYFYYRVAQLLKGI